MGCRKDAISKNNKYVPKVGMTFLHIDLIRLSTCGSEYLDTWEDKCVQIVQSS